MSASAPTPADSSARRSASTVEVSGARIIASNSSRVTVTSSCRVGSRTGTFARSSTDSVSLATTQSCRTRGGRGAGPGVVRVQLAHRAAAGLVDAAEDGLVEVDAAEVLHALRHAEDLDARRAPAQDGGVERAPAEVVDAEQLALGEPAGDAEVHAGRLGLGEHRRVLEAGLGGDVLEQPAPVGTPVRRVGQDDPRRRLALLGGDPREDVAQHGGEELARRAGLAAQRDRRRVAQPALDPPRDVAGTAARLPRRGVADGQ